MFRNLMIFLVLLCGCRTAATVKNDPLVGLPTLVVVPTLPALKIVDEPKYLPALRDESKYLPLGESESQGEQAQVHRKRSGRDQHQDHGGLEIRACPHRLVTLGHPVPIEPEPLPEPLPKFIRPELPPLPPLFPDGF